MDLVTILPTHFISYAERTDFNGSKVWLGGLGKGVVGLEYYDSSTPPFPTFCNSIVIYCTAKKQFACIMYCSWTSQLWSGSTGFSDVSTWIPILYLRRRIMAIVTVAVLEFFILIPLQAPGFWWGGGAECRVEAVVGSREGEGKRKEKLKEKDL